MNLGCNYINSQLRNMKQLQEKKVACQGMKPHLATSVKLHLQLQEIMVQLYNFFFSQMAKAFIVMKHDCSCNAKYYLHFLYIYILTLFSSNYHYEKLFNYKLENKSNDLVKV